MSVYEEACHRQTGEVVADRMPVACYLAVATPVIGVALILLAAMYG